MKEKFARIPEPLRRQILFRMGIGLVSVILLITALLIGGDWRFCVPCAALAVFFLGGGTLLFFRGADGRYVIIEGVCTEIERSAVRRRLKSFSLQGKQFSVRIMNQRQRIRGLAVGDTLTVYVSEKAMVYEVDGCKIVNSYIALCRKEATL